MSKNKKNSDFEKVLKNDKNTWKYAHVSFKGKEDRTKLKGFTLHRFVSCFNFEKDRGSIHIPW